MGRTEEKSATQQGLELGKRPGMKFRKLPLEAVTFEAWGSPPEPELVKTVGISGVLQPILVRADGDGTFVGEDGRRRYLAAQSNGLKEIPAIVLSGGDLHLYGPAVALQTNDTCAPNPIVELEAIEELIRQWGTKASAPAIAKATGIKLKTVNARRRLIPLRTELRDAWKAGKFGTKVGEACARLTDEQQLRLVRRVQAGETIGIEDVNAVKRVDVEGHQRTLPDDNVVPRSIKALKHVKTELALELGAEHEAVEAVSAALEALEAVR